MLLAFYNHLMTSMLLKSYLQYSFFYILLFCLYVFRYLLYYMMIGEMIVKRILCGIAKQSEQFAKLHLVVVYSFLYFIKCHYHKYTRNGIINWFIFETFVPTGDLILYQTLWHFFNKLSRIAVNEVLKIKKNDEKKFSRWNDISEWNLIKAALF